MIPSLITQIDEATALLSTVRRELAGVAAVSPHITKVASALVSEMLHKRCPDWRAAQLFSEATTAVGMTGDKALIADLKVAIRSHGKIEYEVEAVEDVLIKHYRARTCS